MCTVADPSQNKTMIDSRQGYYECTMRVTKSCWCEAIDVKAGHW